MKLSILAFTFLFFSCSSLKAQQTEASEFQQVQTTIGYYFDGWAEYLSRFKPRPRPEGLTTRIVALDITENIASAKTEIDTGKDVFTDYFNLIKTNEGWFIVDKIAVKKSK